MDSVRRFFQPPGGSFFLFGPRGTGKTTWLKQAFPDALVVDLLSPPEQRAYLARPERLEELVQANPTRTCIVVDEVQKVPALLDVVHRLIEARPGVRFVLTGSSSRKLKRAGVDLLAGRAVPRMLHPFMAAELGTRFRLSDALTLGLVPLVRGTANPAQTLAGYANLYLREEVQAEGLVRRVGDFARFLESLAFSHAGVMNTSEIARECEVNRKTVEGYIQILEDLLLCFRLPVFARRAKRILTKHEKFYYFDSGVFRSLRPMGALDRPEEAEGGALEGLVAQHLRAWAAYRDRGEQVFFWRTKSGSEVDFVVYGQDTFAAIEVKNAKRVFSRDTRALREFAQDYPGVKTCLLYRGRDRLMVEGVTCIPCEDFLLALEPSHPLL